MQTGRKQRKEEKERKRKRLNKKDDVLEKMLTRGEEREREVVVKAQGWLRAGAEL